VETKDTRSDQAYLASVLAANLFDATDKITLYLSTFNPTGNSTFADFDANRVLAADVLPVDLTGAWQDGLDDEARALLIYNTLVDFVPVAGTVTYPVIVGGWYIRDLGNTMMKAYGRFETPFTFSHDGDHLFMKPFVYMDELTDADAEFISGP